MDHYGLFVNWDHTYQIDQDYPLAFEVLSWQIAKWCKKRLNICKAPSFWYSNFAKGISGSQAISWEWWDQKRLLFVSDLISLRMRARVSTIDNIQSHLPVLGMFAANLEIPLISAVPNIGSCQHRCQSARYFGAVWAYSRNPLPRCIILNKQLVPLLASTSINLHLVSFTWLETTTSPLATKQRMCCATEHIHEGSHILYCVVNFTRVEMGVCACWSNDGTWSMVIWAPELPILVMIQLSNQFLWHLKLHPKNPPATAFLHELQAAVFQAIPVRPGGERMDTCCARRFETKQITMILAMKFTLINYSSGLVGSNPKSSAFDWNRVCW